MKNYTTYIYLLKLKGKYAIVKRKKGEVCMTTAIYKIKYAFVQLRHKYVIQAKGDASCFPIPYLDAYSIYFDYDEQNDIFLLEKDKLAILKKLALENKALCTMLQKDAYFIFICDILGLEISKSDKRKAYKAIKKQYGSRQYTKKLSNHYSKIDFRKLEINEPYGILKNYLHKSLNYKMYLLKVKNKTTKSIAIAPHGFNILFTDSTPYTYGVGLIECIIRNENGIKGRQFKYMNLLETHANPKYIALKDIMERQTFINPDLFFMKGYLGLAFNERETIYGAIYAVTEPFVRLLFSTIGMKELMDYVFLDNKKQVKEKFNTLYPNCYDRIYNEKNVFKRMEILDTLAMEENLNLFDIYKILFNSKKLVNTCINHRVIAFIYLSRKINQDKRLIFDLIDSCYPWALAHHEEVTLTNWAKHVKLKFGKKTYQILALEYRKYKQLLDAL